MRWRKQRRYADDRAGSNTWEVANDKLLGLVRQTMAETGETATINVKGYSMRPFLEHLRDRVVLKPVEPGEIRLHDVVLAEIYKGVYVLHRVIAINGDDLTLMGDGNIRGTEHCQRKDVCGVAIKLLRPNGHYIDTSDANYQRRVRHWLRLLPVRRWLLFFYKLTI
ncbi:MAG: S24/S26 family peptidase [Bacteroidaceae bacterium]|nr:S24/S26 family peptidase [Bacteroidaceae bacterium]